jgi:hypothetical protein
MLKIGSKVNEWGCVACYNHRKNDNVDLCTHIFESIELLALCPLGEDSI